MDRIEARQLPISMTRSSQSSLCCFFDDPKPHYANMPFKPLRVGEKGAPTFEPMDVTVHHTTKYPVFTMPASRAFRHAKMTVRTGEKTKKRNEKRTA